MIEAWLLQNNNEVFYTSASVSDDTIAGLKAKKFRFYVRGRLVYLDIFKGSHETRFCAYYPTNGPSLNLFNCSTWQFYELAVGLLSQNATAQVRIGRPSEKARN